RLGPERRRYPRPPLWLNLLLLIIAMAGFAYAQHQRDVIRRKTVVLFRNENSPAELNRMRDAPAQMGRTQAHLAKELDGRMEYKQALQGEDFYISIDTAKKKMQFRIGKSVVREADVQIGETKRVTSRDGKTWTFSPLKGAFNVVGKDDDYESPVSEWLYAMRNQTVPSTRPVIHDWLGHY